MATLATRYVPTDEEFIEALPAPEETVSAPARGSFSIVIRDPRQAFVHLLVMVVGLSMLFAYIIVAKPGISADAWRARVIPSYPSNVPAQTVEPVRHTPPVGNEHFQYASKRLTGSAG